MEVTRENEREMIGLDRPRLMKQKSFFFDTQYLDLNLIIDSASDVVDLDIIEEMDIIYRVPNLTPKEYRHAILDEDVKSILQQKNLGFYVTRKNPKHPIEFSLAVPSMSEKRKRRRSNAEVVEDVVKLDVEDDFGLDEELGIDEENFGAKER